MKNVAYTASRQDVELVLATHLHQPPFMDSSARPFNFHVHLLRHQNRRQPGHKGFGFLTLPTKEIGTLFLSLYSGGRRAIIVHGRIINFSPSNQPHGRVEIVERITSLPYVNPVELQETSLRHGLSEEVASQLVAIQTLQFGWDCRDQVVSIESEASPTSCTLGFDDERRQFRLQYFHGNDRYIVAIRLSQIDSLGLHFYRRREHVILFYLFSPPIFEVERNAPSSAHHGGCPSDTLEGQMARLGLGDSIPNSSGTPLRQQISFLPIPSNHQLVAPFASLVVRLVCQSARDFNKFRDLAKRSDFQHFSPNEITIERRRLFSPEALQEYERWLRSLPWSVAFQVEAIVRRRSVDVREMLSLLPRIKQLITSRGKEKVGLMLRDFATKVASLYTSEDEADFGPDAVNRCFDQAVLNFNAQPPRRSVDPTNGSLCDVYHATVTPTTIYLLGPFPERSNRVIRGYPREAQESFLRVTFADEESLQYRFDREVDSRAYIKARIGPILLDGLWLARRKFEFLAYSQSALKEHTVW